MGVLDGSLNYPNSLSIAEALESLSRRREGSLPSVTLRSTGSLLLESTQRNSCGQPAAGQGHGDGRQQKRWQLDQHRQCPAPCPSAGMAPAGAPAARHPIAVQAACLGPGGSMWHGWAQQRCRHRHLSCPPPAARPGSRDAGTARVSFISGFAPGKDRNGPQKV